MCFMCDTDPAPTWYTLRYVCDSLCLPFTRLGRTDSPTDSPKVLLISPTDSPIVLLSFAFWYISQHLP